MARKRVNIWTDLSELVEDQLNLQVKMQFKEHHRFMLNSGLGECRSVMDIGTGNGTFLAALAKAHLTVSFIGIDNRDHMVKRALRDRVKNIRCMIGDMNDPKTIPEIGNVDGVLMRYVLLHMGDTTKVLGKLHKALKDKARLWIIDLDLEHDICRPPNDVFELIKGLVRKFCDVHGKDVNVGSKLVGILKGAGFRSIKREIEPLNTDTTEMAILQKFIIQEVMVYRAALQNAMTDDEFDKVKVFIDGLPRSGIFLNYGVALVSAVK